jgi:hypothetical protein
MELNFPHQGIVLFQREKYEVVCFYWNLEIESNKVGFGISII